MKSIIEQYIEKLSEDNRYELERLRKIVLKNTPPGTNEIISYGFPTFKYKGKPIIGFAAHKEHLSIYPFSGSLLDEISGLKNFKKTKGSIHFSKDNPIPEKVIKEIIDLKLNHIK